MPERRRWVLAEHFAGISLLILAINLARWEQLYPCTLSAEADPAVTREPDGAGAGVPGPQVRT